MAEIDETDAEILRLLVEDGRRPYSEIAEAVDLSPPAISERIDRLQSRGVLDGFTARIDRTRLGTATPVLVEVEVEPTAVDGVRERLTAAPAVEHVFVTADARVLVHAVVASEVRPWLLETLEGAAETVRDIEVSPVETVERQPGVTEVDLAVDCDECGNTVTHEGTATRVGEETRHFCCGSCEQRYRERYERHAEAARD